LDNKHREYAASEILEWSRADTPMVRVQTATDAIPGGLAMAMVPLMVNWSASSLGFGPEDFYLVHNVNVASNPIEGTTMLATVKVPAGSVESVEFVMVKSKVGNVETDAGHALLRFVFRDDNRPVILSNEGNPIANNASFNDLVLSWEAWRPPRAEFDPVAGLDPETYALALRCFNGSVRCTADAILDRPWTCYPLQVPDVPNAADELLYVSLLIGDAVARQTITTILNRRIEEDRNLPEDYSSLATNEWVEIKDLLERENIPENPLQEILDGKIRYHLLLRSCITMALTMIDWANVRIHHRAELPEPRRIRVTPESLPNVIDNLAQGKRSSVLARIPAALHWLTNHQTVIPGKAYKLLDEVGLLQRRDGRVVEKHYDNRRESPYGRLEDHLIY
jgi:hypothetical protein